MAKTAQQYGQGITCPFQRDGKGDFANQSGVKLVNSNLAEAIGIIGPIGSMAGEVPWRGEVGSQLHTLRHRHLHSDLLQATAAHMVSGAARAAVAGVIVGQVSVETEGGRLHLRMKYRLAGSEPTGDELVERVIEE